MNKFIVSLVLFALLATACTKNSPMSAPESNTSIAGIAQSSNGVPLSSNAQFEVQLMEVIPGAGAQLMSSERTHNPGAWPLHFKLDIPTTKVSSSRHLQLFAQVVDGGQVLLQTATPIDLPVPLSATPVELMLTPVDNGPNDPTAATQTEKPHFEAQFTGDALTRITESRTMHDTLQRIDYSYRGALLIEYLARDATHSRHEVHVRFTEMGKLLSATRSADGKSAELASDELAEIRNRASLLRSLALAQRSSEMHH